MDKMILGLDVLGLAHPLFPVKALIQAIPNQWAIGVFDDPFGSVLKKLKKVLKSGKISAVRIHAHWSREHRIVPLNKLKKKLPHYEELAKKFPNVKIYISHSCEYYYSSEKNAMQRISLIKSLAPSCIPVDCPLGGEELDGVISETHFVTEKVKRGKIVSNDGMDIHRIPARGYMKNAKKALYCFGWTPIFNLRGDDYFDSYFIPPKKRKLKPTFEDIQNVVTLMKNE